MKLALTTVLIDQDGEEWKPDGGPSFTLRKIVRLALLEPLTGDEKLGGMEKLALADLAHKALDDEADFTAEEITSIKNRIGRGFGQIVVWNAYRLLEGKPVRVAPAD